MSLTPKSKSHSSSSSASTSSASTSHGHYFYYHGSGSSAPNDTIQLLVDSANFIVNPDIFASKKDTMLYRMFFSSPSIAKPNEKGQFVIEGFSATVFGAILVSGGRRARWRPRPFGVMGAFSWQRLGRARGHLMRNDILPW